MLFPQILSRQDNRYTFDLFVEVLAEVANVTGQNVCMLAFMAASMMGTSFPVERFR
jgi:hypothetical protein